jgi:hypothetical protein
LRRQRKPCSSDRCGPTFRIFHNVGDRPSDCEAAGATSRLCCRKRPEIYGRRHEQARAKSTEFCRRYSFPRKCGDICFLCRVTIMGELLLFPKVAACYHAKLPSRPQILNLPEIVSKWFKRSGLGLFYHGLNVTMT